MCSARRPRSPYSKEEAAAAHFFLGAPEAFFGDDAFPEGLARLGFGAFGFFVGPFVVFFAFDGDLGFEGFFGDAAFFDADFTDFFSPAATLFVLPAEEADDFFGFTALGRLAAGLALEADDDLSAPPACFEAAPEEADELSLKEPEAPLPFV